MPEDPEFPWVPLEFERLAVEEMLRRSREFLGVMQGRRTIRHLSSEPVPPELIENAIRTAGTAPSGAHQQAPVDIRNMTKISFPRHGSFTRRSYA